MICFFKGFNDVYINIKTQILLLEPLLSINKVSSLVLQQERELIGSVLAGNKIFINVIGNQGNWRQEKANNGNWKP